MKKRTIIWLIIIAVILIIAFLSGYAAWNGASPERSCASCHEINPSLETWMTSSHREISCLECHGTAMSNGIHSMKEKSKMLFSHVSEEIQNRDIHLSEDQIIETMGRCVNCHQEEYKKWESGGHAASYADIFLNETHNKMEQPYWDCFRCHGMHYEGTIYDLVDPVNNKGPWKIIDEEKAGDPSITCMACHEIHSVNNTRQKPSSLHDPNEIFYERKEAAKAKNPKAGLYVRADQIYLRADHLPEVKVFDKSREVTVSSNPLQRICFQCHSPNYRKEAGSEDDHTLTGVHEGLSCMECHETHSNDASGSCKKCHPVISNCGQDHLTMNTSYHDKNSPNDIHHVKCTDCHDNIDALYAIQ